MIEIYLHEHPMPNSSFSDLTPIDFMQTFIIKLTHVSELLEQEQDQCQQLIMNIGLRQLVFPRGVFKRGSQKNVP